ncbi:MAG: MliC family protein [Candidatus Wolfebacteria bacterium]|nr:MliC family protein [Candidatus Wolfebacteria bacterium]
MKNKTYLLIFFIIVLLTGCGYFIFSAKTNPKEEGVIVADFKCDDKKSIFTIFYPKNDTRVDIILSDGRKMSVPRAISASGARYANADESFVFWNKGDTAFIT